MRSARSEHLLITDEQRQNTLLSSKSELGALSLKALESLTQSPNNAHLVIMMTPNQNIPLHRDIEFGCAIFKAFRISWTMLIY